MRQSGELQLSSASVCDSAVGVPVSEAVGVDLAQSDLDLCSMSDVCVAPVLAACEQYNVGDLIEIFKGFYKHWAVYVGDGFIVHMAPASNVPGACADSLMSVRNKKALVKKEKLRDVVGKAKWRINNRQDKTYKPRPAEDIVRDACARVGETLYYSVFQNNCEHFAKELRYGIAKSRQVG
ncbi:hypothetical protein JOQ06_019471 [Pogonophryne albipinna]|uniref:LRAT domain-containing protein n=1 Tax=Pogonophryne albipinna TaxID=1090488 RepID=A0AAD6AA37_9TELE|nr:hypothetical protein JOQ06_019471 [Pogonophryne albipinna]